MGGVAVGAVLGACSTDRGGPGTAEGRSWIPGQPAELFEQGGRHFLDNGVSATTTIHGAGELRLPTGRLVAADPSWLPSWERLGIAPYTATVPAGSYPLTLAVVEWPTDRRVAAAKLTIRDEPIVAWDMALRPGEDLAALRPGEAYVVGIDVATMVLLDAAALPAMARRTDEDPESYEVTNPDIPVELADPSSGANAIAFQTGWGDGAYAVWIGRASGGAVACFLVDMAMLAAEDHR